MASNDAVRDVSVSEVAVQVDDLLAQCIVIDAVSLHNLAEFTVKLLKVRLAVGLLLLHLLQQLLDGCLCMGKDVLSA